VGGKRQLNARFKNNTMSRIPIYLLPPKNIKIAKHMIVVEPQASLDIPFTFEPTDEMNVYS
jgi:hypothetical protein